MKALVGHAVENILSPYYFRVIEHEYHVPVVIMADRHHAKVTANSLLQVNQFTLIQSLIDVACNITDCCTHDPPPVVAPSYFPLYSYASTHQLNQ